MLSGLPFTAFSSCVIALMAGIWAGIAQETARQLRHLATKWLKTLTDAVLATLQCELLPMKKL